MAAVNTGHARAYGADDATEQLSHTITGIFGAQAQVYPVFNGTGANVVALQSMIPRWGAVIAAESAHINTDENGAPERIAGIKLATVPTPDGKLTPELIDRQAFGFGDPHHAQPAAVSVSQVSELGTIYTPAELQEIADHAHSLGMWLHLDGARLANAAAALDISLAEAATGADVISLGATKNGAMGAEAVVVVNPDAVAGVEYVRKMDGQLASKMRFMSVQLTTMFGTDLWHRNASHANKMAARLAAGAQDAGTSLAYPAQANSVFAHVNGWDITDLRAAYAFYDWTPGVVRWMCSWDTTMTDVEDFIVRLTAARPH